MMQTIRKDGSPVVAVKSRGSLVRGLSVLHLFLFLAVVSSLNVFAANAHMPLLKLLGPNKLKAGQRVEVVWDKLPAQTGEFELLLTVDLPEPVTIRLTESESPRLRAYSWLVPNISCFSARLVLRKGEAGEETTWAESEPFRIEYSRREAPPLVVLDRGELWLKDRSAASVLEDDQCWSNQLSGSVPGAVMVNPSTFACSSEENFDPKSARNPKKNVHPARVFLNRPLKLRLRI